MLDEKMQLASVMLSVLMIVISVFARDHQVISGAMLSSAFWLSGVALGFLIYDVIHGGDSNAK